MIIPEYFLLGWVLLGGIWGPTALLIFKAFRRLYAALEARHPALWKSLGSPSGIKSMSREGTAKVAELIAQGGQEGLDDEEVVAQLVRLKKLLPISRFVSVAFAVWTLAAVIQMD